MFTSESTQYLQLVSRILIDGSEEANVLFRQFISQYPTPISIKNMTNAEKDKLIEEDERMEVLLAAIAVSYTHLDVYKRQVFDRSKGED